MGHIRLFAHSSVSSRGKKFPMHPPDVMPCIHTEIHLRSFVVIASADTVFLSTITKIATLNID